MAGLRVFVSSTCVDLNANRTQLRTLLARMGHEPIMSDYSDVLYDPRAHTHASCIREVPNADMMILLIGSRFGGTIVPQALPLVDIELVEKASNKPAVLSNKEKLSVTQVEVVKAIEAGVPVFAFVDARVYADHHVYQTNKASGIADKIKYPSIEKPETAAYIFEFINFLTHRLAGNSITPYNNFSDIEEHILKQWSLLFQRLLQEERERAAESRKSDIVIDQIEDLKAAILQSISQGSARDVARNVMKFRRLADFLIGFRAVTSFDFVNFTGSMDDLLREFGVVDVKPSNRKTSSFRTAFILSDGTYVGLRLPIGTLGDFYADWTEFHRLDPNTKQAIIEAVSDASAHASLMRYFPEQFSDQKEEPTGFRKLTLDHASSPDEEPSSAEGAGVASRASLQEPPTDGSSIESRDVPL